MLLSSIFATSVSAYSPEEIPVIFTADSVAVEGGKLTVDILAMTDYDATIYNAWLENDVRYEWHKDDIIVLENTTNTYEFTAEDVGCEFYVLVTCWDYTMKSENITVAAAREPIEPVILTKSLPEAQVGEEYYAKIECADPEATFGIYYNPGRDNEFEETGLVLSENGEISGVPKAEGEYGFCIASYGEDGEGYTQLTLKVVGISSDSSEPDESEPDESFESEPEASLPDESVEASVGDDSQTESESASAPESSAAESEAVDSSDAPEAESKGVSLWVVALIAIAAAAIGAAAMSFKKKQ